MKQKGMQVFNSIREMEERAREVIENDTQDYDTSYYTCGICENLSRYGGYVELPDNKESVRVCNLCVEKMKEDRIMRDEERIAELCKRTSPLSCIYNEPEDHTIFESGARKETEGKLRYDLIPPEVEKAYAEVLSFGAKKYADRNWEKGIPTDACIAALRRHLAAFQLGEAVNEESGYHHLKHCLFWVAAMITFEERKTKFHQGLTSGEVAANDQCM